MQNNKTPDRQKLFEELTKEILEKCGVTDSYATIKISHFRSKNINLRLFIDNCQSLIKNSNKRDRYFVTSAEITTVMRQIADRLGVRVKDQNDLLLLAIYDENLTNRLLNLIPGE